MSSLAAEDQAAHKQHYLPSLTGLRFFAAASILLGHLVGDIVFQLNNIKYSPGILNVLGMPLFYVLSGFIIHYNYGRTFHDGPLLRSSRNFLFARFSRIYPLFLFYFIFCLLYDNLLIQWIAEKKALLLCSVCLTGVFSWAPFVTQHYLLLQYGRFGVAWSISTEFFFYLTYLFFARFLYRLKADYSFYLVLICVAVGYAVQIPGPSAGAEHLLHKIFGHGHPKANLVFVSSFYRWAFYFFPGSRIFEFLMGCATAQLFITHSRRLSSQFLLSKCLWGVLTMIFAILFLLAIAFLNMARVQRPGPG